MSGFGNAPSPCVFSTGVQFAQPTYTISEDGGSIEICASITNPDPNNSTTGEIILLEGDASELGNFTTQSITFSGGSTVDQCITVAITDDDICNGDRGYVFKLQNVNGGDNAIIGNQGSTVVMVMDDESQYSPLFVQDFDGTPEIWSYSGDGTVHGDYGKENNGIRIGGSQSITLAEVPITGLNDVHVIINTASVGGIENNDALEFYVALDGEDFSTVPDIKIQEENTSDYSHNKSWSYSATGVAETTAGTPAEFYGDGSTGYATVIINIPDERNSLKLKIKSSNNDNDEYYYLDNIVLQGMICLEDCDNPEDPTTTLTAGASDETTANLSWASNQMGNAESYVLLMAEGALPNIKPTDGTFYGGDANFGTGASLGNAFVLANKANTPANNNLTASSLSPGTLYGASIFGYNCFPGFEKYSEHSSDAHILTRPENATSFQLVCSDDETVELGWNNPETNFDGVVVVARQGGIPASINSLDPDVLSVNSNFSQGAIYGESSKVVYRGNQESVIISGLTSGNIYTFKVIPYVKVSSPVEIFKYATGTQRSVTVGVADVSSAVINVLEGSLLVQWQTPDENCFDDILVVAKEDGLISASPNLESYEVNSSDFSDPMNPTLGDGSRVIYQGTGNSVSVSGITAGELYCIKLFVRKGTAWSAGIEVCQETNVGTKLYPGDMVIIGADNNIASGGTDRISIINLVELTKGTSFNLANMVYEYKDDANESSERWYSGNGNLNYAPPFARIEYTGNTDIPEGSVICLDLVGQGNVQNIKINGVNHGDDFTVTYAEGSNSGFVAISASDPDALFLTQGVYSTVLTDAEGHAFVTLHGRVLGAIQFGGSFQPTTVPGNSGGSRVSRGYPNISCWEINLPGTGNKYVYYNYDSSIVTREDLQTSLVNFENWEVGSGSNSNELPSNICTTTYTFEGQITPGLWTGAVSNSWFDCQNWSNLAVPDATTDVVIQDEENDPVIDGPGAMCRDLRLESGGVTVQTNGELSIYGDVIRRGHLDAYTGKVAFLGSEHQHFGHPDYDGQPMTSSTNVSFNELVMNKPTGILYTTDKFTISEELKLIQGIIVLDPAIAANLEIEFSIGATATGASNNSFVVGKVRKHASEFTPETSFTFPIGDTTETGNAWYQPVHISGPNLTSNLNGTYDAQYFAHAHPEAGTYYDGQPYNNRDIGKCDHWVVTKDLGEDVQLAFKFTNEDEEYCNDVEVPADLDLARWNGLEWDDIADDHGEINQGWIKTGIGGPTTVYGAFAFASTNNANVLPIELLEFSARPDGGAVMTHWATATETNNDYFTVERSADGMDFHPVGIVHGAGHSTARREYRFRDLQPLSGVSYYRLRQTDFDGGFSFGPVRAVKLDAQAGFGIERVYRGEGGIELLYRSPAPFVEIEIFNVLGQRVFHMTEENRNGQSRITATLERGVYLLRLRDSNGNAESRKFFY